MRLRLDTDRITEYFSEAEAREFDRPHPKLIIGSDEEKRVVTVTIIDPPGRALAARYDSEADALSLSVSHGPFPETGEVRPDLIVDYDEQGRIGALEFLNAKRWFSDKTLKDFKGGRQVTLV